MALSALSDWVASLANIYYFTSKRQLLVRGVLLFIAKHLFIFFSTFLKIDSDKHLDR